MPRRKSRHTTFYTALDVNSAEKLQAMAMSNGQTYSEFLRMAVLDYMKRVEEQKQTAEDREPILAEQLRKSTNRICSLLAKTAIDVNMVARYIWETADDEGRELYEQCQVKAIKRVRQQSTAAEKQIAEGLAE